MARPYKELQDRMGPERRKHNQERAERSLLEMNLQELRKNVAHLTQEQVAELLEKSQATICELEQREDVRLSSLAEYVRALGGEIEIRARFPNQPDIIVTQFEDVRGQIAEGGRPSKGSRSR
jgi:DNA-binding XRE family transcriptional regulator